MRKILHTRFIFALPGLCLLAALFIGGMVGSPSSAQAEGQYPTEADINCTGEHHRPFFGTTVVVNSGEVICSNLTSFGGAIIIRGEVKGDVVAFGENIVIDGRVNGNVTSYGGNVTLQDSAYVNGDMHLCSGDMNQSKTATLHGNVYDCTESVGLLLVSDMGMNFRFWSTLTWVALGLLLTSLLPEHVMLVRSTVESKIRRSLVLGLLSVLLAPAILAVLLALIISIPLAIIVAIGLIAAWALGTVAVGWFIGEYILRFVAPQRNTRLLQIVVGLLVLALAGSLPIIGWLITLGSGLLGLGAVFLSRFGTRIYGQPKQPLSL